MSKELLHNEDLLPHLIGNESHEEAQARVQINLKGGKSQEENIIGGDIDSALPLATLVKINFSKS